MRILHAGRFEMGSVHGTHHALWQLARAQASAGHDVTIANLGWDVPPAHVDEAAASGVKLVGVPVRRWRSAWSDDGGRMRACIDAAAPDAAHLQYVRVPELLPFSRALARAGVPWVVSLHGGMKPAEMVRHRLRKQAWWHLVERRVHGGAAGIHFVTAAERDEYRRHHGRAHAADAVVANVVEADGEAPSWKGAVDPRRPRLVTLGRHDIWHKGLDHLAAMTRQLNARGVAADVTMHGSPVGRYADEMAALLHDHRDLPLRDGGVVGGARKQQVLAEADLYVQFSRFELFGMALVEALRAGTPVALSEACDLAPALGAARAALVLPMDPAAAAGVVADALADGAEMARMAARGHAWWRDNCRAVAVVAAMDRMYGRARAQRAVLERAPALGLRPTDA